MGDVANKDEAFKCLDIARAALKAGEHARAEKFAAKALRLYRCSQVCGMVAASWLCAVGTAVLHCMAGQPALPLMH